MYNEFFGLKKDPFSATPDPTTIYLTTSHRDALAGLSYAILAHKGFAVLSGDAGTGKTTVLSRVVEMTARHKTTFSVILNSALTASEFLESVMLNFGLDDIPASKAQRLQHLQNFLMEEYTAGRTCILIIDEAQNLPREVLEEVRLLSNCELPNQKLLQIILSGQSELDAVLERQDLRQLKQRLAVWLRIVPLTPEETVEYIRFRWTQAGGDQMPFEQGALAAIAAYAKGIPRIVNILCDNSLLLSFGDGARGIALKYVDDAAAMLMLRPPKVMASVSVAGGLTAAAPSIAYARRQNAGNALEPHRLPEPLSTLRRYTTDNNIPQSRLSRLAAKFGWARQADGVI